MTVADTTLPVVILRIEIVADAGQSHTHHVVIQEAELHVQFLVQQRSSQIVNQFDEKRFRHIVYQPVRIERVRHAQAIHRQWRSYV